MAENQNSGPPNGFANWQQKYQDAMRESDPPKLAAKVADAESAIFLRLQTLSGDPDHDDEKRALHAAIESLRCLKTEKLNFPDWQI